MGDPNEKPTEEGQTRTVEWPNGRLQDQKAAWVFNNATFENELQWVDEGSPYWPREEPRGPAGPSPITIAVGQSTIADKEHDNALADAKFENQQLVEAAKAEIAAIKAELDKLKADRAEAWKQKEWERAAELQVKIDARQDRIDALRERQQQVDNDYREKVRAADEKYRQDTLALQKGSQTGYIDGVPTLSRQEFEARQANEPGNYYNYAFRSRGMEPPPLESRAAPATAATTAGADTRDWWMKKSLQTLEEYPDSALMELPPEILAKFRNEFLLTRPALMALLPPDRIKGEGAYAGQGFSEDVITKHGVRAPGPKLDLGPSPETAAVPPSTFPAGSTLPIGGVGAPQTMPAATPLALGPSPETAAVPASNFPVGSTLPIGGVGPPQTARSPRTPEEAAAFAEQIKRELVGVR